MSYFDTIKEALYYDVGNLEPVHDMVDAYNRDRFIFQFPLDNKQTLSIYLYDDDYDLYADFGGATLLVYDHDEWVEKRSVWKEELDRLIRSIENNIRDHKKELEEEREDNELELERVYDEVVSRFVALFDGDFVTGVSDLQLIDLGRSVSDTFNINDSDELYKLLEHLYGLETKDVPDK